MPFLVCKCESTEQKKSVVFYVKEKHQSEIFSGALRNTANDFMKASCLFQDIANSANWRKNILGLYVILY